MKADERVSDDGLSEAIELHEGLLRFGVLDYTTIPQQERFIAWLVELQSCRAAEQAALQAVEEMAKSIAWDFALYEGGVGENYEGLRQAVVSDMTPRIAKFIAPLYAKLAEYADVVGECRKLLSRFGTWEDECETIVAADAAIARIDALLGAKGETG